MKKININNYNGAIINTKASEENQLGREMGRVEMKNFNKIKLIIIIPLK